MLTRSVLGVHLAANNVSFQSMALSLCLPVSALSVYVAFRLKLTASSAVSNEARGAGSEPAKKSDKLSDKALRKLARREKKQRKRAERKLRKAAKRLAAAQGTSETADAANASSGTAQADASFDIDESSDDENDGNDDGGDEGGIDQADEVDEDEERGGLVDPDEADGDGVNEGEDLMAATSTSGGDGAGDQELDEEEWFLQQSRNREGAGGAMGSKAAKVSSKVCISDIVH
jgi:hypothetical protein